MTNRRKLLDRVRQAKRKQLNLVRKQQRQNKYSMYYC